MSKFYPEIKEFCKFIRKVDKRKDRGKPRGLFSFTGNIRGLKSLTRIIDENPTLWTNLLYRNE